MFNIYMYNHLQPILKYVQISEMKLKLFALVSKCDNMLKYVKTCNKDSTFRSENGYKRKTQSLYSVRKQRKGESKMAKFLTDLVLLFLNYVMIFLFS